MQKKKEKKERETEKIRKRTKPVSSNIGNKRSRKREHRTRDGENCQINGSKTISLN